MQRATLGKRGFEAASQLQARIARAFSSNSLVNTMDMTAAIQYILTATQSLRRISSLRRNHSQRVSKYSPARRTISCYRILMNIGLAGLSNRDS